MKKYVKIIKKNHAKKEKQTMKIEQQSKKAQKGALEPIQEHL